MSRYPRLWPSIRLATTLTLLGALGWKVDWRVVGENLAQLDCLWLIPALTIPALSLMLLAWRWHHLLRVLPIQPRFSRLLKLTLSAQFFNSILPGSTGGDFFKISVFCKSHPGLKLLVTSSVLFDRLLALLALLLIGGSALLCERQTWQRILGEKTLPNDLISPPAAGGLLILGVLGLALLVRKPPTFCKPFTERLHTCLQTWQTSGILTPRHSAALLLGSLLIHLGNFTSAYCLTQSIHLSLSYAQVLSLMPVVLLGSMLPLSVNGHGIREMILLSYFTMQGVSSPTGHGPRELCLTFSILYVLTDALWTLPGAWIFLRGGEMPSKESIQKASQVANLEHRESPL